MSGLDEVKKEIKKKLTLLDYASNTPKQQQPKTPEKTKMSVYLTPEHVRMFNEMCVQEMRLHGKPEKSQLICEAIEMLYQSRVSLPTS